MILTIGQYIEALMNTEGRFRTLDKVYPIEKGDGYPTFSMPGHGLADFEVMAKGVRHLLRCPLKSDAETANKLRALYNRDKGLGSHFFTEWELLEKEIILFDSAGNPVEVDILARVGPHGEKIVEFIQKFALNGDNTTIISALRSFGELIEWAQNRGCGGISAHKMFVTQSGEVSVTGFSANDFSAMIALALLFTAAMPSRFAEIGLPLISDYATARPVAERLCAAAFGFGFPEPSQILAGDLVGALRRLTGRLTEEISALGEKLLKTIDAQQENQQEEIGGYLWRQDDGEGIKCVKDSEGWRYVDRRNRPVIDVVWLSATPFREGRAEVESVLGKGLIDKEGRAVLEPLYEEVSWDEYWGLVAVMTEGRWSLLNRDGILLTQTHYDWLGECFEGVILAQKDGKCGFLNTEGQEVIPFLYDDATSFSDGYSFVTSNGDSYFIDSNGRKIYH